MHLREHSATEDTALSTPDRSARPRGARLAFTSTEAARYLGVSVATVRRWSNAGILRGSRTPGGQRRFSREELDAFVASLQNGGDGDEARPAA
jgi:excisionase family DNA binding protein